LGAETAENSRKPVFGVSVVGGKRNFAKVSGLKLIHYIVYGGQFA